MNHANITDIFTLLLTLGLTGVCFGTPFVLSKLSEMNQELRMMVLGREAGVISLVDFTLRCRVHVSVARWFLAGKAQQLNGIRDVDESGDTVFLFGKAKQKYLT
jgi:hypothetical protein